MHRLKGYGFDWLLAIWHYLASGISDTQFITSGVPQGFVLGPLLFLCYINDISCCFVNLPGVSFALFADDAKLYSRDSLQLQCALDNLIDWCAGWQLRLAPATVHSLSERHWLADQ